MPRVEPLAFRQVPVLAAVLCFAAGIAIPRLTPPVTRPAPFLLASCALLAALAWFALRRGMRFAPLPVLALWGAAGIWCAQMEPYPSPQTPLVAYADNLARMAQARVVRIRELPARAEMSDLDRDFDGDTEPAAVGKRYALDLAMTAIEDVTPDTSRMVPISGGVRATLIADGGKMPSLACGEMIEAPVRLRPPQRFRDPGVFQYADYLLTEDATGIAATTSIPAAKLRVIAASSGTATGYLRCRVYAAQSWASARLLGYQSSRANRMLPRALRLSVQDAATLTAMLFGDRSRLTRRLRLGFERTGSFHLFVVSGLHLGVLAAGLFWIARRLRLAPWLATFATIALTSAYALLTGFGVPVERALLMSSLFLVARLLFRERVALNALGAAALVILVWSPRALFETSFQMTFLALAAIVGVAVPLTERRLVPWSYAARGLRAQWKDASVPPRLAQLRVMLRLWGGALGEVFGARAAAVPCAVVRAMVWAAELAVVGIVAEAVMVLPMALYFHRATVFALPANMVSVPLIALLAPLALGMFCCALISPWLAVLPGACVAAVLHAVQGMIQLLARSHGADLRVPGPVLWRAMLALVCVGLCWGAARRARHSAMATGALLAAAVFCVVWPATPQVHRGELELTAIDVGQGDSLLLVGPGGHTMLIDAGGPTGAAARAENASGATGFDTGEQVVSPYLWSRQMRRLDVAVLSHAHSDHMGGMPAVLANFHPRELWVAVNPNSAAYRDLLREAAGLGVTVRHLRAADTVAWDGTTITVLAPARTYANAGPPGNNDSLVLRVQYGRGSVLLEGDAEAPSEHAMVAAAEAGIGPALGPDTLLKVGHHGSRTSTNAEFLHAVEPRDAVISVGRGNTFGHPRPEVIGRLAEAGAHVFRTDEFGMTTFLLTRDGEISSSQPASNP